MYTRKQSKLWHQRVKTLCLSLGLMTSPFLSHAQETQTKALALTPSAALESALQLPIGQQVQPFAPGSHFYGKVQNPQVQQQALRQQTLVSAEVKPIETNAPLAIEEQPSPHGQQSINVTPEEIQRSVQAQQEEQAQAVQAPGPIQPRAQVQSLQSAGLTSAQTTAATTFTPLCPTLSINTLYTLSGVTTGGSAYYHFQITARSKSTVILTGQTAGYQHGPVPDERRRRQQRHCGWRFRQRRHG